MEVAVVRRLAAEARAAGRDPASDPIPGLRRDILFASTADEEAGGLDGAGWLVDHRPELLEAVGALNECGGVSVAFGGRRFYPIGVAEKGYVNYRIVVNGTWGHGSMPRSDNAAVRAAIVVSRLAEPGATRLTPAMTRFFDDGRRRARRTDGRPRPADRVAGSGSERGGDRRRLRRHVRPGRPGSAVRHGVAERHPRRGEVQRHPGRRRDPRRLPDAARHGRADAASRPPTTGGRRALVALRRRGPPGHARGRCAARHRALPDPRVDDPGSRSGRHPGPGHGAVRDRRQAHHPPRASRPTASRRSGSSPTSGSSSGSTASTSASASTRSGSACRSSTTWSAASAAETGRRPKGPPDDRNSRHRRASVTERTAIRRSARRR